MAHECGCHAQSVPATQGGGALLTGDVTVGAVTHHDAGTLDIMKEMGINHCCGASLTLPGAAAMAGVARDVLLDALNRPATVRE